MNAVAGESALGALSRPRKLLDGDGLRVHRNEISRLIAVSRSSKPQLAKLGCIIDGCSPRLRVMEVDMQFGLDRRGKRWVRRSRNTGIRISQIPWVHSPRSPMSAVRAMDASFGGQGEEDYGPPPPFPRLGVRDPYKLLGVSRDASDEEIREAHNYLSNQYWGHEKSREAIEAAYDKIIMESFRDRKNSKINLKTSLKKKVSEAPPQIRALTNMIEIPPTQTIGQRAALFILLGVWSVMNPADGGPAFQVAVSLAACIYFLNDRLKSLGRAFLLGFGSLVVGWVSGSFLVPVLSSYILPPSWSLELSTALFSYIFLWASCTFLK